MFSKEESAKIRQEFWTSFGKSFPKKWVLYNTKIKDFSFKFFFDTKKAMVLLCVEGDLNHRITYFERLVSLKTILTEEYLPEAIFDDCHRLDNGKEISQITVTLPNVCIHNKNTWQEAMEFLNEKMELFELFWFEYEDIIKGE